MAQIDPNAQKPGEPIVLSKFEGLKNTLQPERMGPADLQRARNVDLDDDGQLHRRRGVTLRVSGVAHSPFTTAQGVTFLVLNGELCVLRPNYARLSVVAIVGSDPSKGLAPLSYVQVGTNLHYSGPADSGVVDLTSFTRSAWGSGEDLWLSPVVNPTPTLPAIAGRLLGQPPNATSLAYYRGRIYLAEGNTLWATVPWLYNFVDKTKGYVQFESTITMLASVGDGLYVGTDEGVYFLAGDEFPQKKGRVMDSGVIPGSMQYIPGELGNPPQIGLGVDTPVQVSIAFMSTAGFCVGQDGGQCSNLTETKFWFPAAQSAASLFRRRDGANHFVTVMQSGGDPSDEGAIGDYIDVTVIRASAGARTQWVASDETPTLGDVISYVYVPYS